MSRFYRRLQPAQPLVWLRCDADGCVPIRTDITAADIGRTDDPYFAQAVEMAGGLYFWPDNCLSADVVNIYCSLPCQVLVGNMSLDELTRAMDDAQLD